MAAVPLQGTGVRAKEPHIRNHDRPTAMHQPPEPRQLGHPCAKCCGRRGGTGHSACFVAVYAAATGLTIATASATHLGTDAGRWPVHIKQKVTEAIDPADRKSTRLNSSH